mgnify:CR=1 FL=1
MGKGRVGVGAGRVGVGVGALIGGAGGSRSCEPSIREAILCDDVVWVNYVA